MFRKEPEGLPPWLLAVAAIAAASAAAVGLVRVVRSRRRSGGAGTGELDRMESAAVEALRRDPVTSECGIDVAALAPGIIELTGTVPSQSAGQRAARLLHAVTGVRTVINRVDVLGSERKPGPQRWGGEAGGGEWTGMRVGMGRRRQSPDTDPARPDDSARMLDRSLEVGSSDIADATSGGGVA